MILWQNPNPTSSFNPQTITTLDMDSFKYIGIKNKPYDTASNTITHIYSIDEFKKLKGGGTSFYGLLSGTLDDSSFRYRRFIYKNNTSIEFSMAYDSSGTGRPGSVIPLEVIGYK